MPEPFVVNNSNATIYYKPEGPEHNGPNGAPSGRDPNPCTPSDGAFPIAPNTSLYVPVDGIKTTKTPEGKVYKVPTGATLNVDNQGYVSITNTKGVLVAAGVNTFSFSAKYCNVPPPDASWNKLANSKPK